MKAKKVVVRVGCRCAHCEVGKSVARRQIAAWLDELAYMGVLGRGVFAGLAASLRDGTWAVDIEDVKVAKKRAARRAKRGSKGGRT